MSHIIIFEPALKTTGFIKKFTKKLVFEVDLGEQELSDFLAEWKLCSAKEAHQLYYGKIYRVKNISANHLILQARKRQGNAYHYIDCKYHKDSAQIVMEVQSPNSGGYFYMFWPLLLMSIFVVFSDKSTWAFSMINILLSFFYIAVLISIGAWFLNFSIENAKEDLEREMYKLTGLKPSSLP